MTDGTNKWSELRFEFEFSPDDVDPRSDEVNVLDDAFIGRLTVSGLSDAVEFDSVPLLGTVLTLARISTSLAHPRGHGYLPNHHAADRLDFARVDDSIWISSTSTDDGSAAAADAAAVLGALDAFCSWALTETRRRHPWLCANAHFVSWFGAGPTTGVHVDDVEFSARAAGAPPLSATSLRFGFEFESDQSDPCDPDLDLLWHVVTGDLIVTGPPIDLSARFQWIPLLNVAMQSHDIAARLAKPESFAVLEFTESEDQLVFIRLDDVVRITATWTGESVHIGVHTVRTALEEFRRWAFVEALRRHPCLEHSNEFCRLLNDYA